MDNNTTDALVRAIMTRHDAMDASMATLSTSIRELREASRKGES